MLDILLAVWIVFFVIFLVANIITDNQIFGGMASIILLLLGLYIIVGGIQISDGATIVESGDTTTVTWTYDDADLEYGSYNTVFGLSFVAFSIYLLYANFIKKPPKTPKVS